MFISEILDVKLLATKIYLFNLNIKKVMNKKFNRLHDKKIS